jgi:hypothetical protein
VKTKFNIYCDESCHLENDQTKVMVLGAVWCPDSQTRTISRQIRTIKIKHGLPQNIEIKWTKVSNSRKLPFYKELIDFFFKNEDLHFRALVVPDKEKLDHVKFKQDHDTFYYKMYFQLLLPILNPDNSYNVYIDIKDTLGIKKQILLHEMLSRKQRDFQKEIVEKVQQIHSHESELMQLADLMIGSISYANRCLHGNSGKLALIHEIRQKSGYDLIRSTFLREEKFNIFSWEGQKQ